VYLGVAAAAYGEVVKVLHARQPPSYAQPLAYHPDVRRHVAKMSVDLEAARLITYRSAWLSDTWGPIPETTAVYRAKYIVGEAVSGITRTALTLAGAHGIFKGSRLEQLFRDGALAPIQPPQADFCLWNMSMFELDLDPRGILPPLKPI
jgi:alkylation response protein AidB-like acyl-CoA dehydrogenase